MKRSVAFGLLLALVSATGCAGKTGSARGPAIQRTAEDQVERDDHGDLARPVFGQAR